MFKVVKVDGGWKCHIITASHQMRRTFTRDRGVMLEWLMQTRESEIAEHQRQIDELLELNIAVLAELVEEAEQPEERTKFGKMADVPGLDRIRLKPVVRTKPIAVEAIGGLGQDGVQENQTEISGGL